MISEQDVQAYRRDGVIVVPEVLGEETLAEVRTVIAELVAGSAKTLEHTDVYDLEPGHTAEEPRVRRIKAPHKVHAIFNEIVRSAAGARHPDQIARPGPAAARLQAQHEVGAIRLAGGMASGLGVLSAHQ